MGVTYKLRDEVVHFIISQRQTNPLFSCRQLAESASQKFGVQLSKSSVHDVLKESGIITPRGRKPKNKFAIPYEKKKQIQASLSKVKLLPAVPEDDLIANHFLPTISTPDQEGVVVSAPYEGAGKIFMKALWWDLGIFSDEKMEDTDWDYYLTYVKGIKVVLENNKTFFVDSPLPIGRCIRETVDTFVNNISPILVHKVSDLEIFEATMAAKPGFKMENISIVDQNDHELAKFNDIMEFRREFLFKNRLFVDSKERVATERLKILFFSESILDDTINEILESCGVDSISHSDNIVTIIPAGIYDTNILREAVGKLNAMSLYDEQNRLVQVKIQGG